MNTSKPITERQQAFLEAYRVHGKVKPAAEQAGCSRELHYGAMRTSETYREEFSLVQQRLADELEEAMWQRAVYGVKIPKFYRGKVIGYDIRYSDTLLMRLLEANDPEKFGGIRRELQQQSREDEFCVRWDRDEVGRPTLPRMTGPQPPAPPRPPRPPVPSISELGIPVTYAEWAAARGITGRADCGPVDQEKIQRWAAGGECSPVEWVPDEDATDLVSDDAEQDPLEETDFGADGCGSDDSDAGFCVRWHEAEPDQQNDGSALHTSESVSGNASRPDGPDCPYDSRLSEGPSRRENAATVGRFPVRKRLRRGQGRAPAPRLALGRYLRPQRPATFGHALPQSLQGVPHNPATLRPFADCRPRLNLAASRAPPIGVAALLAQPIAPRRPGPGRSLDVSGRSGTTLDPPRPFLLPSGRARLRGPTRWRSHPHQRPPLFRNRPSVSVRRV